MRRQFNIVLHCSRFFEKFEILVIGVPMTQQLENGDYDTCPYPEKNSKEMEFEYPENTPKTNG